MNEIKENTRAVACYSRNLTSRMQSTSGGVFTELAQKVISDGGVVFGAKFDQDYNVVHDYTESIEGLGAFRGSKYPQSRMGTSFLKVREFLNNRRLVLFAGTACHIEGLLNFLGKDYDNLICIDFICFGVASPKAWSIYLDTYFNKNKIEEIKFKDKTYGWKTWHFMVNENGRKKRERGRHSIFMNGYLNRMYLRPSCYECVAKGMQNRKSDFTISDCWGIDQIDPEFYDTRGVSGLYIHSDKGNKLFDRIKDDIYYKEIDAAKLIKYNPYAIDCVKPNVHREEFFKDLNNEKINKKELFTRYYDAKSWKDKLHRYFIFPIKNFLYAIKKR